MKKTVILLVFVIGLIACNNPIQTISSNTLSVLTTSTTIQSTIPLKSTKVYDADNNLLGYLLGYTIGACERLPYNSENFGDVITIQTNKNYIYSFFLNTGSLFHNTSSICIDNNSKLYCREYFGENTLLISVYSLIDVDYYKNIQFPININSAMKYIQYKKNLKYCNINSNGKAVKEIFTFKAFTTPCPNINNICYLTDLTADGYAVTEVTDDSLVGINRNIKTPITFIFDK